MIFPPVGRVWWGVMKDSSPFLCHRTNYWLFIKERTLKGPHLNGLVQNNYSLSLMSPNIHFIIRLKFVNLNKKQWMNNWSKQTTQGKYSSSMFFILPRVMSTSLSLILANIKYHNWMARYSDFRALIRRLTTFLSELKVFCFVSYHTIL